MNVVAEGAEKGDSTAEARKRFTDFALAEDVLEALAEMGFEACTPIQEKVIAPILAGRDVVGKAETGTGKTIGFGAPLVGKIDTARVAVQALVLTPTRELAQQVAEVLRQLGKRRGLRVALLVGGVHASDQLPLLRQGSQLVVGTPGRVLDFLKGGLLALGWCETVVLDEADRMLDMGFIDEVNAILDRIPRERQTLLFSATIPRPILGLLKRYMRDPEHYSTAKGLATVPDIRQLYVRVGFPQKFAELRRVLDAHPEDTAIVFCNTRRQVIDLDRMLWGHGYSAGALHGDQEQDVRFKILDAFRSGEIKTLVATDVASRGLDIEAVTRVINYDVPEEVEAYVHRIGRTGRANNSGIALTFVAPKERRQWEQVMNQTGFAIEQVGPDGEAGRTGPGGGESRGDEPQGAGRDERARHDHAGSERRGRRDRGRRRRGGRNRGEQGARAPHGEGSGGCPDAASGIGGEERPRDPSRRRRRGRSDLPHGSQLRGPQHGGPQHGGPQHGGPQHGGPQHGGPGGGRTGRAPGAEDPSDVSEESREAIEYWKSQEAARRRSADRPRKVTLDAVDDDFLKNDYFEVDPGVLERAEGSRRSADPHERDRNERRGGEHLGGQRRHGQRAGGEHRHRERGHEPSEARPQRQHHGGAPLGARREGSGSEAGASAEGTGKERNGPGRRRRSRRRGRGRGRDRDRDRDRDRNRDRDRDRDRDRESRGREPGEGGPGAGGQSLGQSQVGGGEAGGSSPDPAASPPAAPDRAKLPGDPGQ